MCVDFPCPCGEFEINRLQGIFLVCGLVGVVSLCLYPPWEYTVSLGPVHRVDIGGYSWIFDPPPSKPLYTFGQDRHEWSPPRIALARLALEIACVVGITVIAIVFAGWKKAAKPPN